MTKKTQPKQKQLQHNVRKKSSVSLKCKMTEDVLRIFFLNSILKMNIFFLLSLNYFDYLKNAAC